MADRVYLHIGAPKTGTTYLQQLMQHNRGALEGVGVRYADGRYPNDRVWATEVLRGFSMRNRPPQAAQAWDRIRDQCREWSRTAVFSHEFLGACTHEQAQRVLEDLAPAEVHIVFTARDYVKQTAAVWQERLKYGFDVPFSRFTLDNDTPAWSWQTQDVPAILDRWCPPTHPTRVHVVTVPSRPAAPEELWSRFASVIGAAEASVEAVGNANTSLGLVEAELLRRVDQRVREKGVLRRPSERTPLLRDLLANTILAQRSGERFTVPPELWRTLRSRAEADTALLAGAGYDVVGSLDDLLPEPSADPGRLPEQATEAELLDASLDTITALLARLQSRARATGAKRSRGTAPHAARRDGARGVAAALRDRLRPRSDAVRRGRR